MVENYNRIFERIVYNLKNLGYVFAIKWAETFNKKTNFDLNVPMLTSYRCNKCDNLLIIVGHNSSKIYYECLGCGKIHKAYKNRVLWRF